MKVLIIYSPKSFTKQTVIDIIVAEGYTHEFLFMVDLSDLEVSMCLREASEVWVFGDCRGDVNLVMAEGMGCDVWQMA